MTYITFFLSLMLLNLSDAKADFVPFKNLQCKTETKSIKVDIRNYRTSQGVGMAGVLVDGKFSLGKYLWTKERDLVIAGDEFTIILQETREELIFLGTYSAEGQTDEIHCQ